ncbi:Taf7 [Kluyveromyces lactis]|nr:Taf7 [Kluyveromyces lactis]
MRMQFNSKGPQVQQILHIIKRLVSISMKHLLLATAKRPNHIILQVPRKKMKKRTMKKILSWNWNKLYKQKLPMVLYRQAWLVDLLEQ